MACTDHGPEKRLTDPAGGSAGRDDMCPRPYRKKY